ncbi:hypothetical protein R6Q57_027273 [Mikania cordata]
MDVLWLRNPFPNLVTDESLDLQIPVQRSNNKTIALFDEWYGERVNSIGMKEQDVLFSLMRKGAFKRLGLRERLRRHQRFMQIVAGVLKLKSSISSRFFTIGRSLKVHLTEIHRNFDGPITQRVRIHGTDDERNT